MSKKFEGIRDGDRVRLVYEFTVADVDRLGYRVISQETDDSHYAEKDLVSVEIIEHPLPTIPGWYEGENYPLSDGHLPYLLDENGIWHEGGSGSPMHPDSMASTIVGRLFRLGRVES